MGGETARITLFESRYRLGLFKSIDSRIRGFIKMANFIIMPKCRFRRIIIRDSADFDVRRKDTGFTIRVNECCIVFNMTRGTFRFTFDDDFGNDFSLLMDYDFFRAGNRIGCKCIQNQGTRHRADRFTVRF